jgi:hypothetical protein
MWRLENIGEAAKRTSILKSVFAVEFDENRYRVIVRLESG